MPSAGVPTIVLPLKSTLGRRKHPLKKCNFALAIFILGLGPASFSQENPPVSIQTEIPASVTKKASSKITFETPNNLAKNLLEALLENDAAKLKSAVPTPEQLRVWFETVSDDDPINVRQKEWLIDRSKSLLSGKAKEILAKKNPEKSRHPKRRLQRRGHSNRRNFEEIFL